MSCALTELWRLPLRFMEVLCYSQYLAIQSNRKKKHRVSEKRE